MMNRRLKTFILSGFSTDFEGDTPSVVQALPSKPLAIISQRRMPERQQTLQRLRVVQLGGDRLSSAR